MGDIQDTRHAPKRGAQKFSCYVSRTRSKPAHQKISKPNDLKEMAEEKIKRKKHRQ